METITRALEMRFCLLVAVVRRVFGGETRTKEKFLLLSQREVSTASERISFRK